MSLMYTPDKHDFSGSVELRASPTMHEALAESRHLNSMPQGEERLARLSILNASLEANAGTYMWVGSRGVYVPYPGRLDSQRDETASQYNGRFRGFREVKIDSDGDGNVLDSAICLDLYGGIVNFSNEYISGSFERVYLLPVIEIDRIESEAELVRSITGGSVWPEVKDKKELFSTLQQIIADAKTRMGCVGRAAAHFADPQGIETFDMESEEAAATLQYLRNMRVFASIGFGILQHDQGHERFKQYLEKFNFEGYFLGILDYPVRKGDLRPHFAFEVYAGTDDTSIGNHTETASPVVFVPVSDRVPLEIRPYVQV